MNPIPRIVIAGTHSGCGKTTLAGGIMAALTARGLTVQPFKVGPDFIDPSHHTRICGRVSRNLDPFMMGEAGCLGSFCRAIEGADVAVIEGVMGLFDGVDGTDLSSTAHVARILNAPVILVADVKGMSRSVHALTHGYSSFDPGIRIAGILYNRVGSPRHRTMIAGSATLPSFGWIPRDESIGLASRHLGLVMGHESDSLKASGGLIEEHADLDAILATARCAPPLSCPDREPAAEQISVRIGIAFDPAFCFYYQDNLDRLRQAGAELVFFSPISDPLPDVHGIYLGGGYPELHLPALESSPITRSLGRSVENGFPIYAECGGLMYLVREIGAEKTYRMAGILPADAVMTKKVQALGYVRGETTGSSNLLTPGNRIHGHEFHYSRVIPDPDARYAIRLERGKGIDAGNDGLTCESAFGSYTHTYFSRRMANDLVAACRQYSLR